MNKNYYLLSYERKWFRGKTTFYNVDGTGEFHNGKYDISISYTEDSTKARTYTFLEAIAQLENLHVFESPDAQIVSIRNYRNKNRSETGMILLADMPGTFMDRNCTVESYLDIRRVIKNGSKISGKVTQEIDRATLLEPEDAGYLLPGIQGVFNNDFIAEFHSRKKTYK